MARARCHRTNKPQDRIAMVLTRESTVTTPTPAEERKSRATSGRSGPRQMALDGSRRLLRAGGQARKDPSHARQGAPRPDDTDRSSLRQVHAETAAGTRG